MSETETIVRDIFGDSDESDDEFEGFDGDVGGEKSPDNQQQSDDKNEDNDDEKKSNDDKEFGSEDSSDEEISANRPVELDEEKESEEQIAKEAIPDISDSDERSDDDDDINRNERHGMMYDFDIMLQKRKEMNSRRRRRKNIDIINDSDDIIAELIHDMRQAADEDFELNRNRQTATRKLKMMSLVETQLKKIDLREALLDSGILSVITDWLTRLPDGSLPHLQIREKLLRILSEFNIDDIDRIKASGIGKAVMYLYKHPKETKENKKIAGQLIANWSRPIFNMDSDFHAISRDQREKRDFEHMAKFKRSQSDSGEASSSKMAKTEQRIIRPGEKGWVPRARVPMPSMKDYVVRPKSTVEMDLSRITSKKPITKLEKHMRNFREMKKINKMNRAIPISIEGRKMAL
ncbi:protein IWS1 homolog [Dermatophagoides pteronyssinus]|uniref:Protein IWS1 homolog n=2 Tax=Dermatophagoides pteronyssinus TaxID=6956 RepID=A0A6P6Y947_DERPT|nr:protein IWS1 homolog [Dermatophagoides pteronyssinus]KAH9424543.1 Transcription factor iws1 [Dermatophagoides pteronyssinus]